MEVVSVHPSQAPASNSTDVYGSYAERVVYASILAAISVIGTVGNCLVITAVFVKRQLQTKTNVMVVNLSVADLISCINLPWMSIAVLSEGGWPLPYWICKLEGAIIILSTGCSIYTLAGIAISRCCLITMPRIRYHDMFTAPNIAAMVTFFWLVPISVIVVAISFGSDFLGYGERYSLCLWDTYHERNRTFSAILMVVFYPIPLIAISISSLRIWQFVRRNTRRITSIREGGASSISGGNGGGTANSHFNRRQMAVTKNLFFIIAVFLVLMSPYGMLLVISGGARIIPLCGVILQCNSCVNPFIYARHPHFKVAFKQLLQCNAADGGIFARSGSRN